MTARCGSAVHCLPELDLQTGVGQNFCILSWYASRSDSLNLTRNFDEFREFLDSVL